MSWRRSRLLPDSHACLIGQVPRGPQLPLAVPLGHSSLPPSQTPQLPALGAGDRGRVASRGLAASALSPCAERSSRGGSAAESLGSETLQSICPPPVAQGPCSPTLGVTARPWWGSVFLELEPLRLLGLGLGLCFLCSALEGAERLRGAPGLHMGFPSPAVVTFPGSTVVLSNDRCYQSPPVSPTCLRCVSHDTHQSLPPTAAPPSDRFTPTPPRPCRLPGASARVGG